MYSPRPHSFASRLNYSLSALSGGVLRERFVLRFLGQQTLFPLSQHFPEFPTQVLHFAHATAGGEKRREGREKIMLREKVFWLDSKMGDTSRTVCW